MKKKVIILISVLFIALIAALIFFLPYIVSKPLEKELNVDFSKIDMVTIGSGSNGKAIKLSNKKDIDGFLNRFSRITVRKDINQNMLDGFPLSVILTKSGKKVGGFIFGGDNLIIAEIENKNVRYRSNKSFSEEEIDKLEKYYKIY